MRRRIIKENKGTASPGQDIVAVGLAGMAGAKVIAQSRRQELEAYFSPSYVEEICDLQIYNDKLAQMDRNLEQWKEFGVTEWEAAGEGGILTALWNLAGVHDIGIRFTLRQIPVKQSAIEICEYYDLNPYRLYSKGCFLLVADKGGRLADRLKKDGLWASLIGQVTPGNKMEMIMEEGTACLERPQPDELEKVIPGFFLSEKEG